MNKLFVVDSSALLSGKPFGDAKELVIPEGIRKEFREGGRDYRQLEFLILAGMQVMKPSLEALSEIEKSSLKTGDVSRLSNADKEVLALTLDLKRKKNLSVTILSDDYSIQNLAEELNLPYQAVSQRGIKEKFEWIYRCTGCRRRFDKKYNECPYCGSRLRQVRKR
ncbi:MAG TPA: nucleic acid-binding protein [Thermoplasmata archaeon]|jgi:UPF0271 protein|nr:nucleic acid-binding protein [Thermoplasmata archaeon]